MLQEQVDLKPPLLIVTPEYSDFETAVEAWNDYMARLKRVSDPGSYSLSAQPLNSKTEFMPLISRVFPNGDILQSTSLSSGHDGNGGYELYTKALLGGNIMFLSKSRLYRYPHIEDLRDYIHKQRGRIMSARDASFGLQIDEDSISPN